MKKKRELKIGDMVIMEWLDARDWQGDKESAKDEELALCRDIGWYHGKTKQAYVLLKHVILSPRDKLSGSDDGSLIPIKWVTKVQKVQERR